MELNSQAGIMSMFGENIQNQVFDSLAHKLGQSSGATWGGNDFGKYLNKPSFVGGGV